MAHNSDGGLKCLKYMLLVSNIMFMAIGILTILMGNSIVSIYNDLEVFIESTYFSPAIFTVTVGIIVLLVSLFGCVGAVLHSTMTINIYTLFMCILLILEIAAAITAFVRLQDIVSFVSSSMYHSMSFYKNETEFSDSWNLIQEQFSCCGVHNLTDWSTYNINEATIVLQNMTLGIPKTCCAVSDCTAVFSRGCLDYIASIVSESGFLLGTGAVCIAIVQLLGIVFGNLLAKTIRQAKSREEMIRQQRNMLYDQINNGKSTLYG